MTTINASIPALRHADSDVAAPSATIRRSKTAWTMVWVVVLLGCLEMGLRTRAWYRHGSASTVAGIYVGGELHGRRLLPGAVLEGHDRRLSINEWGFRGESIPKTKPANTIRIAALGDSTTFGMEASTDNAVWVARMVHMLNDSGCGEGLGRRYDAINAAVPGYTLAYSIDQMQTDVAAFEPDVVVVLQAGTDLAAHGRRQWSAPPPGASQSSRIAKWVGSHSLLINMVRVNTTSFTANQLGRDESRRVDERGLTGYRQRLNSLIDICHTDHRRVILCTCPRSFGDATASPAQTSQTALAATALANNPAMSLAGLNDAYDRYNEAIRKVAAERGVSLVDLDRLVPKGWEYFVDAVHLNDRGHRVVARAVAEAVAKVVMAITADDGPIG